MCSVLTMEQGELFFLILAHALCIFHTLQVSHKSISRHKRLAAISTHHYLDPFHLNIVLLTEYEHPIQRSFDRRHHNVRNTARLTSCNVGHLNRPYQRVDNSKLLTGVTIVSGVILALHYMLCDKSARSHIIANVSIQEPVSSRSCRCTPTIPWHPNTTVSNPFHLRVTIQHMGLPTVLISFDVMGHCHIRLPRLSHSRPLTTVSSRMVA